MPDLRETFYEALQRDFEENGRDSLLCRWLAEEKDRDVRIELKRRQANLRNTPESRRACGAFLIRSLLEEPRLRRLANQLPSLPSLLRCEPGENLGQLLRPFLTRLEKGEEDPPRTLLLALSAELLERCPRPAERAGAYSELQERFLDLTLGTVTETDYLRLLLDLLLARKRLRLNQNSQNLLWNFGLEAGGGDFYETGYAKLTPRHYQPLRRLLDRPELPPVSREELKGLHENVSDALLTADAQAFLYDGGQARPGLTAARRKDRILDLLDFCRRHGMAVDGLNRRAAASPPELEGCEDLFRSLNQDPNPERNRVILPLQIDPRSGAGLYIMGKDHFRGIDSIYNEIPDHCCYVCIFQDDVMVDGENSLTISYVLGTAGEARARPSKREPPAVRCFLRLDKALECYHEHRRDVFYSYQDYNGFPPPGCPAALSDYFVAPFPSAGEIRKTQAPEEARYAAGEKRQAVMQERRQLTGGSIPSHAPRRKKNT